MLAGWFCHRHEHGQTRTSEHGYQPFTAEEEAAGKQAMSFLRRAPIYHGVMKANGVRYLLAT